MAIADSMQNRGRLLIVDDEEMIRDLLSAVLRERGYEVTCAENVAEAVAQIEKDHLDLVLTDLNMPGKSGIELLSEIVSKHQDTAVIMISGSGEINNALTAVKMGAYDYLTKPISPDDVTTCVGRALEKQRLVIENRNYQQNLEKLVEDRTRELEVALQQISRTYDSTIKALGAALDLRDNETEDHSERVAHYALQLAEALGVEDQEQLQNIRWGAYLHDIGKIGIPDSILLKPGKLDEDERTVIKGHPELGERLLEKIPFLKGASELVLHHHEWYDGGGYPGGLKKEQIPLSARIFAVADTIDAMTSDRPYRKALGIEEVAAELQKLEGVQFDPLVVEAFSKIPALSWSHVQATALGEGV
jgi:putative nucleotidyltransferase with HDIG domain